VSESFVYVIAPSPDGPVKIGFSADPHRRVRQLQTGYPGRLTLHYSEAFSAARAPLMEKIIHRTISYKRKSGEWFDMSVEDAVAEVQFALIRYGEVENLRYVLNK
jgi:predicted GIY-YIG superfamily endonuclease